MSQAARVSRLLQPETVTTEPLGRIAESKTEEQTQALTVQS
jgi:hypothetical protein